jgi:hypothetical protein
VRHTEDLLPTAASKKNFDFENYTFYRWRAVWMNNAGTFARRVQWKKEKEEVYCYKKQ